MANQYDDIDDFDGTDEGPANLRKALKRAEKERRDLEQQLNEFKALQREQSVKSVLESKGVNAKIARFIPSDVSSPEQVDAWLNEYSDVFGVAAPAPQEDRSEEAAQQARMNNVTRGAGQVQAKPDELLKKVQAATSIAELNELTGNQPSRFQR